jgi:signal peptidase I
MWTAAALSVLAPGAGHVYLGAPGRGAWVWLASRVLGVLALAALVVSPGRWGLAAYVAALVGILALVVTDVVRVGRRQPMDPPHRWFTRPVAIVATCVVVILASIAWTLGIDSRVADRVKVRTDTMAPTLLAGDRLFVAPGLHGPVHRGDLVVYKLWETRFVKRVLGLPGDTLAMQAGHLSIDGQPVTEPYATHAGEGEIPDRRFDWQRAFLARSDSAPYEPSRATWGPLVIPRAAYFVLGDDRGGSIDSRYDGFVPDTSILGRPLSIYFSRDPATGRLRWERFGKRLTPRPGATRRSP